MTVGPAGIGVDRVDRADRRSAIVTSILLVLLVLAFFAPLLTPSRVLATRDMTEFNYPLRLSWAKLVKEPPGVPHIFPQWDPYAHGGQPLLSNPNYGALYPPAWLGLLVPERYAVSLLAVFQALIAAFGARRLALRLGADPPAALIAGIVFAAGPTYLALLQSLIQALGFSWLPWIVETALARLEDEGRSGFRTALPFAGATAMFLLAGAEPGMVVVTGLTLVAIVLARPRSAIHRARLLLPSFIFGVALAGIQVVITLARLVDSPRSGAMSFATATLWSLPAARLPELFFPNFHGDVARPMHGLYFGWGVQDLDYPFLTSIYLTLPIALLGIVALGAGRLRERGFWLPLAGIGVFLALGHHNPLYGFLRDHLPLFASLRYPEKFFLLTLFAALFAGAVEWRRVLDERERGAPHGVELPLALAALLTAVATALAVAIRWRPDLLRGFLETHTGWELSPVELTRATEFYRGESLAAVSFALAATALFAAVRWSRLPRRALEAGLVLLVVAELATYSRPLLRTVRATDLFDPPQVLVDSLRDAPGPPGRVFSTESFQAEANRLVSAKGDLVVNWVRAPLERLSSRAGNLFGLSYALDRDFDLTLTGPAARALALYERLRGAPVLAHRLLGAWNVDRLAIQRAPQSVAQDLLRGIERPALVVLAGNGFALPPARLLHRFDGFATAADAEAAATAAGMPLNEREFLVGEPPPGGSGDSPGDGRVLADDDQGDRRRITYASAAPALLVVATTYDRRWRAIAGHSELEILETAGGYLAIPVPAGEHAVELRFRDPWFGVGAALSTAALLAAGIGLLRLRRPAGRSSPA